MNYYHFALNRHKICVIFDEIVCLLKNMLYLCIII